MNIQLKKLRQIKGLSQDEIAQKLGIKKSRYGTWERGDRMMSLEQACDVADVLGCSLDELAGRDVPQQTFTDPAQAALNGYYGSMNGHGREMLVETARLMADGDSVRIEKNGAEDVGLQEAVG